jgi:uncharacterized protein (TIGR02246 family)
MRAASAVVVSVALAACAPRGSSKRAFASDVPAETELLAADRSFEQSVEDRGLEAWLDAFADDGVQMTAGVPISKGKGEIRELMEGLLSDVTTHVRWDPDHASVAASGDVGYTIGRTTVSKVVPGGNEIVVARLKYLTVWKRQADGHWKVAVETGTTDPL